MKRSRSPRPPLLILALALSLGAHLVAWRLFTSTQPRQAPPGPETPIELEFATVEPPPVEQAHLPEPPPEAPASKRRRRKEVPALRSEASEPQPAGTLPSDAPVRAAPEREEAALRQKPTLLPGLSQLESIAGALEGAGAPSGIPGDIRPPPTRTPEQVVQESFTELQALARRESGVVDSWFTQDLEEVLTVAWSATDVKRRRPRGASRTTEAQVRIVQGASGSITQLELVARSSDARMDAELLADLQRARASLPAPPARVLRGRSEVTSVWGFQFVPAPLVSTSFDIVNLVDDKAIPPHEARKVRLVWAN